MQARVSALAAALFAIVSNAAEYTLPVATEPAVEGGWTAGVPAYAADGLDAVLYIGQGNASDPVSVADPCALRGTPITVLGTGDYFIELDGNVVCTNGVFTFFPNGSNDVYARVTIRADLPIETVDFGYSEKAGGGETKWDFGSNSRRRMASDDGSFVITASCEPSKMPEFTGHPPGAIGVISNLTVMVRRPISVNTINDATKTDFRIRDNLGIYSLGTLREWARDCRVGDLGEDWSRYVASSDVQLDGRAVNFGDRNLNALSTIESSESTNSVAWTIDGVPAMVAKWADDPDGNYTNLTAKIRITSYEHDIDGSGTARIAVWCNRPADADNLWIEGTASLEDVNWVRLESDMAGLATNVHGNVSHVFTVPKPAGWDRSGFYRAKLADGTYSAMIQIEFRVPVYIEDRLFYHGHEYAPADIVVGGQTFHVLSRVD